MAGLGGLSLGPLPSRRSPYDDAPARSPVALDDAALFGGLPAWMISDAIAQDPRILTDARRSAEITNPPLPPSRPADLGGGEMPFQPPTPPMPEPAGTGLFAAPYTPDGGHASYSQPQTFMAAEPGASASRLAGRTAGGDAGLVGTILSGLRSGANLNFNDELEGLGSASGLPGMVPQSLRAPIGAARLGLEQAGIGSGAGDAYRQGRDHARGYAEAVRAAHPVAGVAAEMAGGLALPVGGAATGARLASQVGRGLATGAVMGALSGAGRGEDPSGRAEQAAISGAVGGVVGGIAAPAARYVASTIRPTRAAAAEAAQAASPADEVIENLRRALGDNFGDPSFGLPPGPPGPAADAAVEAVRAGLGRHFGNPSFGQPPGAPGKAADDAIAALTAALDRHFAGEAAPARMAMPFSLGPLPAARR